MARATLSHCHAADGFRARGSISLATVGMYHRARCCRDCTSLSRDDRSVREILSKEEPEKATQTPQYVTLESNTMIWTEHGGNRAASTTR